MKNIKINKTKNIKPEFFLSKKLLKIKNLKKIKFLKKN
jgi:hypothetical protein